MHDYIRHGPWRKLGNAVLVGFYRLLELLNIFILDWLDNVNLR